MKDRTPEKKTGQAIKNTQKNTPKNTPRNTPGNSPKNTPGKPAGKTSLWERYITKEIGIEFKACLYFFAFLFYYCIFRICTGRPDAEIWHMAEMILLTYVIGYVQVFLLRNFDEADELGRKELLGIGICTVIYSAASYLLKWFDRNIYVTLGFAAYIVFMYVCVYLIYKWRRKIDDKILNDNLQFFKTRTDASEDKE